MAYSDGSNSPSSNRDDYENYEDSDYDDNNSIDIVSDRHDGVSCVEGFRDRRDAEAESDVEVTTFQCKKFSIDNILGIGKNREKSPSKYDGRSSPSRSVKCLTLDDDKNSVDASERLSIAGDGLIILYSISI